MTRAAIGQAIVLGFGLTWALAAELIRLAGDWSLAWVVIDGLPGIAFQIVGIVAWRRRPGNRIGPLLVATGFAWFVGTFSSSDDPTIERLAYAFQGYYDALLVWLVLAYPSGRLGSRGARVAVAGFFLTLGVRTLARLAIFRAQQSFDFGDPADVDRYIAETTFRANIDFAFAAALAVIAIVALVVIAIRLRESTGAGRRVALPILLGGIAFAAGVVGEFATAFVQPDSIEVRALLDDAGHYITSGTGILVPLAFLFGSARTRLARAGVADMVVQLGDPGRAPPLRDILARALRDPTVQVAYPVPGTTRYVDADARSVELPAASDQGRAVTRLERDGETIAALIHDSALGEEQSLVTSVAAAARMALDNERLRAEVRAQLEDVRASRARIVSAGDTERRRIERDLHDGAQQRLVTLALALDMAHRAAGDAPELTALLDRATQELDSALVELRELARGVHPSILTEAGLGAAVEALTERATIPVDLTIELPPERPSSEVEATAYFVVSESLANVAKHASATHALVRIVGDRTELRVEVRDDGVGGADARRGSGLIGLADRVAAVGGRFEAASPQGEGTIITAVLPCA